jgi:hypothetical protein
MLVMLGVEAGRGVGTLFETWAEHVIVASHHLSRRTARYPAINCIFVIGKTRQWKGNCRRPCTECLNYQAEIITNMVSYVTE